MNNYPDSDPPEGGFFAIGIFAIWLICIIAILSIIISYLT